MILNTLLYKVFGSPHERKVKKLRPIVDQIRAAREAMASLDDALLAAKTAEFREKLAQGATLEDIKVEAFAVAQEACDRRLGILNLLDPQFQFPLEKLSESLRNLVDEAREKLAQRTSVHELHFPAAFYAKVRELYPDSVRPFRMLPFDVQLIGGLVLHEGCIAEMATGEGKTLAAACPVYLNALSSKGVHVITVNDYLAGRDAANMGKAYKFLGLTVGLIVHGLSPEQRKTSYASDITYGTNNEFGFDYLRDNMAVESNEVVQRPLHYCIVDEVDSILIDEARTPLIISGPAEQSTDKYTKANGLVPQMKRDRDFNVDEKMHNITLTDSGVQVCEKLLGIDNLYGDLNAEWVHHINQALRAHHLYQKDVDYIVREGEVIIVDEHTGRLMEGRRYSDGLHQALEAKEGVKIARENQTLATITFQNFFRMYEKLSGMTGTADTEAVEFHKIYNLGVTAIPTHKPCVRKDDDDMVFKTEDLKYTAIVADIQERHTKGQPILVGTVSIEKSEKIAGLLRRSGIPHEVLNAKNHGREAEIIAWAGHSGRVTIATNMAGRGTDIVLGPGVPELGGLHVLGTERHESRRIDNQLRGRSGRQGDAGSSQFYLSLDDDLMRLFGGERIKRFWGDDEDQPMAMGMVNRAIRTAQKRVEGQNFESRKHLLDYDDVMNNQRKVIYGLRRRILEGEDVGNEILERLEDAVDIKLSAFVNPDLYGDAWDFAGMVTELRRSFGVEFTVAEEEFRQMSAEGVLAKVSELCKAKYDRLKEIIPEQDFCSLERRVLLLTIDQHWKDHLYAMDHLRDSIRFQGYAQKDPLMVYKKEAFSLFQSCLESIAAVTVTRLLNIRIEMGGPAPMQAPVRAPQRMVDNSSEIKESRTSAAAPARSATPLATPPGALPGTSARPARPVSRPVAPVRHEGPKVGRNDPCWCGSGQKYKKCHGAHEA